MDNWILELWIFEKQGALKFFGTTTMSQGIKTVLHEGDEVPIESRFHYQIQ